MSIVERDGNIFKKPENPMDPSNSNWDYTIEDRIEKLENKIMEVEGHLLDLLKTIVALSEPKTKTTDEKTHGV